MLILFNFHLLVVRIWSLADGRTIFTWKVRFQLFKKETLASLSVNTAKNGE